jgi:mono/diheme cytochrome c family protein
MQEPAMNSRTLRHRNLISNVLTAAVVVGCSSEPAAPPASASSGAEAAPSLQGHMAANFDLALTARDGIIAGSLVQAQEAALKLAEQDYAVVLPPDWMPGVERMQSAARELANAQSLTEGAARVAALAQTCGDCHASGQQGDTGRPVEHSDDGFGKAEDMHGRMMRHERAANGFWYGLTLPSDKAWQSGASNLLEAPASPVDKDGKPVSEEMRARLEEVRDIARRAQAAQAPADRAGVYAELLAKCSSCHTRN